MTAPFGVVRCEGYRGQVVAALSLLAIGTFLLGCSSGGNKSDQKLIQEGRIYTAWLYGNQYNKLWERFSPEMKQTFGSVTDLASFAGQALKNLGAERGQVDEALNEAESFKVYSRSAAFDKARHRMLIEWSLAKDGAVTGLVVRPALEAK